MYNITPYSCTKYNLFILLLFLIYLFVTLFLNKILLFSRLVSASTTKVMIWFEF